MNRRTFVASGAGGVVALLGAGTLFGDARDGPAYGSIPTPESAGTVTLDNGRTADRYADGRLALFDASLASQYTGVPVVTGRLKNVSETTIREVRVWVRFLDAAGDVLVSGWVNTTHLPPGDTWHFAANYPRNDPKRIATAAVTRIAVV